MQYALLIYERQESYANFTSEDFANMTAEYMEISAEAPVVGGAQLKPIEAATTVRIQDGTAVVTDGPFAETKEIFGGYFLVEAEDLDTALQIAKRIPAARLGGCVEVRPLVERPS